MIAECKQMVAAVCLPHQQVTDALLDRAIFYLLWQCGLRRGEVEELRLEDLDLPGKRLSVRNGKGMKDRSVYLASNACLAIVPFSILE
mgnify:CR=1 FL=1